MEIAVAQQGNVTVISFAGSIDAVAAETVGNILDAQVKAGQTRLVADVGQLNFISSAGLRALVQALKDITRRGGDFRLASARPNLHKVLDMTGLIGLFKTYPSVEAAVASYAD